MVTLGVALIGTTAMAQTTTTQSQTVEVSDNELEQFATAYKEVQVVTMQAQQEMTKTVQDNGFEVERFNTLYTASQNPENKLDATEEELKNLEIVVTKIKEMQPAIQKQIETVITKQDMTLTRYQQVVTAVQTDTELQKRLQPKLQ